MPGAGSSSRISRSSAPPVDRPTRPSRQDAARRRGSERGRRRWRFRFRAPRQHSPTPIPSVRARSHRLNGRERPPRDVEIEAEDAEEGLPAVRVADELVVPGIALGEPAVTRRTNTCPRYAPRPSIGSSGGLLLTVGGRIDNEAPRRLPNSDRPDASIPGPKFETALPPTRSSTSLGTNHEEIPGPVAIACHTCSGVPGTSTSAWTQRCRRRRTAR